jgi:hypothetical protein
MQIPERAPEPYIIQPGPGFRNVQGTPAPIYFRSPEQAAAGHETVLMHFPHEVLLDGNILFAAGVNPVPCELADHWYLAAHGVTLHTSDVGAAA